MKRSGKKISRCFLPMLIALLLPADTWADLGQAIGDLVVDYRSRSGAGVGVSIVDIRSGAVLSAIDERLPMIPASNHKILTSAFVLLQSAPGFCFTTALYKVGGDLAVIGNGDPTFGDPNIARELGGSIYDELDRWALAVRTRLGEEFSGNILMCTRLPSPVYRCEDWPADQNHRWYQAPAAALNFNNNCLDIRFDVQGDQVIPVIEPQSRFISVINNLRTGSRSLWSARTGQADAVVALSGTVAHSTSEPMSVAINDPPRLLGRVFADRLIRAGVNFKGNINPTPAQAVDWSGAELICQSSSPLALAMRRANKDSLNMAAESMFLYAGDGTWPGSAALMHQVLVRQFGLDGATLVIRDGAGLSKLNRISAGDLAKLLAGMLTGPGADIFLQSLAVAGIDGTMERRLTDPAYKGKVLAKTGYIAGASALSGYVLDDSGKPAIAFSILINRSPSALSARELQDAVCRLMVDSLR